MKSLLQKPSAWVPLLMSATALVLVLVYLIFVGVQEPQKDEGTAAHLWQLLLGGQLPIIALFAIRYFPRQPKQTVAVLLLQCLAGLIACAPVYYLEHLK